MNNKPIDILDVVIDVRKDREVKLGSLSKDPVADALYHIAVALHCQAGAIRDLVPTLVYGTGHMSVAESIVVAGEAIAKAVGQCDSSEAINTVSESIDGLAMGIAQASHDHQ